jgi:hypothetical protein
LKSLNCRLLSTLFLLGLYIGTGHASNPEPVKLSVLVVNAETGLPIPKKQVRIDLREPSGSNTNLHNAGETLEGITDSAGTVSFTLARATPQNVRIVLASGDWTQCSPYQYSLEQIFSSGIVAKNQCNPAAGVQITKVPGRVVVFSQHIKFSDKVKRFPG